MRKIEKETIGLLIDYVNAEDWESVKVVLRGQFLDVFDPVGYFVAPKEEATA